MKKIGVFCGSAKGKTEIYTDLGAKIGSILAQKNWGLVYGGGKVGVMGAVADATLKNGGKVIGVIPETLVSREVAHYEITKLHIVPDMHDRKKMMYELSDAFLVLPGGMGTLDEMFEILTWAQLGLHKKPVYILNEFGFFDSLLDFLNKSSEQGFIKIEHLSLFKVLNTVEDFSKLLMV